MLILDLTDLAKPRAKKKAIGFLRWIPLRSRDLTKRLLAWTSRFRQNRPFAYCRLLDGLQEFVRLYTVVDKVSTMTAIKG
jgi:hypothetical protein